MSIEKLIQEGDFEGALARMAQENAGPRPDPGQLLMAFTMEVRLQRFGAAEATMKRLIEVAPQVAQPMGALARFARAESAATARLTDPAAAGRRAALGAPPPHGLVYVKAAVLHAQKDYTGAAAALAEAKPQTPATPGTLTWVNGRTARFLDLTDTDDLTGPILPCYDGDVVLDLPYSELRSVNLLDGKTSFDVMWMPAEIVTAAGKTVMLRVPAFYVGTGKADMPPVRTGQMTTWERTHGYAQGLGQRDFKVSMADGGMSMVGILQIQRIDFDVPASARARKEPEAGPEKPKSFWKRIFG